MKNRLSFCLAIAFAFVISSCKKEDDTNNNAINGKVKSVSRGDYTYNYTYDSEGRVTLIQSVYNPNGVNSIKTIYSYTPAIVTELHYDSASANVDSTIIYHLNSEGLAIDNASGAILTYDSAGHLITTTWNPGTVYTYEYSDGNMITQHIAGTTYSYTYLDKIAYWDFGLSFLGKHSKNLINTAFHGTFFLATYTYQYDCHERVIKMTIASRSGSYESTETITYTYF